MAALLLGSVLRLAARNLGEPGANDQDELAQEVGDSLGGRMEITTGVYSVIGTEAISRPLGNFFG